MPTKFAQKIYSQLKNVPKGKVTTYKYLAESINSKAYRAVGSAMKNNPHAPQVPCHRVVSSDGSIGGFKGSTSGKSIAEKRSLLEKEGVGVKNGKIIDFNQVLHKF